VSSIAKFSLTDCHGAEHQYEVTRFTVDQQSELQLMLGAPLLRAVGSAISTLVPIIQDEEIVSELRDMMPSGDQVKAAMAGGEKIPINVKAIAKALGAVHWQHAADVLIPIPEMVIAQGGPVLWARIMSKTERLTPIAELQSLAQVSEEQIDTDERLKLGVPADRDRAFGEGNMAEYWKAGVMALVANFSPSGPDGSVNWKGAVSALTGGIVTL
jgi:hypothetical protein